MSKINRGVIVRCVIALVLLVVSLTLIFTASGMSSEEKLIKSIITSANKGNYKDVAQKLGFFDFSDLMGFDPSDYDREDTLSLLGISVSGKDTELGKVQIKGLYETGDEKSKTVKALITINYTDDGESKSKDITKTYNFTSKNGKWKLS